MVINPSKFDFGVTKSQFLDHQVKKEGIQPLEEKATAIQNFPVLNTQRRLGELFGLVNFYRRFV